MSSKIKKITKTLIIALMIIIATCFVGYTVVNAAIVTSSERGELFFEDHDMLNSHKVPVNLFADYGITLWCVQWLQNVEEYMTAVEQYYHAFYDETSSSVYNGPDDPYKYYRRSETLGLIETHRSQYEKFLTRYNRLYIKKIYCDSYDSDYDDQAYLNAINSSLPGIGAVAKKSIEYNAGDVYTAEEYQDALFALTALPQYDGYAPLEPETLTEEEKEQGYFNIEEKQQALWEMDINCGTPKNSNLDRNLGDIAKDYKLFYETIHNGTEDRYEDIIEVANGYDDSGNLDKEDIEETTTEIDGEEYKTYKYEKTIVEIDTANECYVLGPYCIDYSVDDNDLDINYTTDGYEIKYNAIENITVYNQDKVDITTLGGSFKIAYSYDGTITEENEGKLKRINDQYYYEMADGEEISAFESRKEFYIIIYRGDMEPEDFTGFYAKIDFQYLEHITGTLREYIGNVVMYYYTEQQGEDYEFSYSGGKYYFNSMRRTNRKLYISFRFVSNSHI